jgi:hypothetical protein
VGEEDDVSSQYGASSSHDSSEDDRLSSTEIENEDLDEKLRWYFVNKLFNEEELDESSTKK